MIEQKQWVVVGQARQNHHVNANAKINNANARNVNVDVIKNVPIAIHANVNAIKYVLNAIELVRVNYL